MCVCMYVTIDYFRRGKFPFTVKSKRLNNPHKMRKRVYLFECNLVPKIVAKCNSLKCVYIIPTLISLYLKLNTINKH